MQVNGEDWEVCENVREHDWHMWPESMVLHHPGQELKSPWTS